MSLARDLPPPVLTRRPNGQIAHVEPWRGNIPVPPHAHPLVQQLIRAANAEAVSLAELGKRAGVSVKTISNWRYRSNPNIVQLVACFNALGLQLKVGEMEDPEA